MSSNSDAFGIGDQVEVAGGRWQGRIGRVSAVQADGRPQVSGVAGFAWEAFVGVPAIRPEDLLLLGRAPFQVGDQVLVVGHRCGHGETGRVSAVRSDGSVHVSGLSGGLSDLLWGDPVFETAYLRPAPTA